MARSIDDPLLVAVSSEEAVLDEVIRALRDPLVVVGADLRIRFASRAFGALMDRGHEAVPGSLLVDLDGGRWNLPALRESLEAALRDGTGFEDLLVSYARHDKEQRSLLLTGRVLYTVGEKLVLLAVEDVSHLRLEALAAAAETAISDALSSERTLELARTVAQLATANRELEAFSYSVSHDLRAPLRSIKGFARLTEEEFAKELPPEGHRYLGIVRAAAAQMALMIDGLLAFAHLGRQGMTFQPTPLRSLVDEVLENHADELSARRVQVDVGELPTVGVDTLLMRQVFENLISNALKYTRNEAEPRLEIGTIAGDDGLEVFVADNGVGFEMAHAGNLFGVFHRLHRAEEYEGTGVGLALVKRIIERHGGSVRAEAEPGKGATFFLGFPEAS
jgi:signal transduction histidine kinase